jgi:transposase, IS30 family
MAKTYKQLALEGIRRDRPPITGGYYALRAHRRAQLLHIKPRVTRKLVADNPLWISVVRLLRQGLSPEQIASTPAHMPVPVRLSHETIYTALYAMPKGPLRARILTLLRRARSGQVIRPFIDAMTLIDERPCEVAERLMPGHWEGDLIKGRLNQSRVGTLVERSTLFVALVKLENGRAETTANGFASILNRFQSRFNAP